jgi:YidC/Oxa1 family membrane protein insertase
MFVIKNYIIDSDKIHAQIQENKKKEPKKQGKFNVNFKKLWNKLRLKQKIKEIVIAVS